MDIYLILLVALSTLAIVWRLVLLPWLTSKNMSPVLLQALTMVISEAVAFAEQMYKADSKIDRKALASDKVDDLLSVMGLDANEYRDEINWLIEAAVQRLPKTKL